MDVLGINATWYKEQVHIIEQTLNMCRKVWNFALGEGRDWIKDAI